jgi:pimeloyl-ACP methyl ester carboxylesterase
VYNKYKSTLAPPQSGIKINLIFAHGSGMNKSIWKYHIDKLYASSSKHGWYLDTVVSVDAVGHGDSAVLNVGKLGPIFRWDENGKDLLTVIKYEQSSTGDLKNDYTHRNIVIGHSLGGHAAVMAGFYGPNLVDSVVPVEAVLYYNTDNAERFTKIFSKISALLIDEFDSYEDYEEFFTSFSFFKTLHPEVQKAFMADELQTVVNKDGEIKYKTKASMVNQMASYLGSAYSLELGMKCLELLRVPVCHVVAEKGNWNPKESIPYIRQAIPKEYLAQAVDIPVGTHLVNGEYPDEMTDVIENFIKLRITQFKEQILNIDPEIATNGDRQKLADIHKEKLLVGDYRHGYYGKL